MDFKNNPLYGVSTIYELSKVLDISIDKLKEGAERQYITYYINKHGKKRCINMPPKEKREGTFKLSKCLQLLDYPEYVKAGWEGQNNFQNAQIHLGAKEVKTTDIKHFYPNTHKKYVEKFLKEKLNITDEALDCILKYVIHKDYLPTGSHTSALLAYFAHKELFDSIYNKMKKNSIKMTLYVDDITLSSQKHIGNWTIKYIQNTLKFHGLKLNKEKIKQYGYKGAKITGKFISQNGKITTPKHFCKEVQDILKEKPIKEMIENELLRLLGKIGYIRQTEPMKFIIQHNMVKKQIKRLHKNEKQQTYISKGEKEQWNEWTTTMLRKIRILGKWQNEQKCMTHLKF